MNAKKIKYINFCTLTDILFQTIHNNIPVHAPSSLETQIIDDHNAFTVSVLYYINFLVYCGCS